MEITLLGTGSPGPVLHRASPGLTLKLGSERVLVDCGARTVQRLLQNSINPGTIETVFFTHHHLDHNAAFFEFLMTSWFAGRSSITVYGPDRTETLVDAFADIYNDDIKAKAETYNLDPSAVEDIDVVAVESETWQYTTDEWEVSGLSVPHSGAPTYAYRFEEAETGTAFVFSADTAYYPALAEFAEGADMLLHEALLGPPTDDPPQEGIVWENYLDPLPDQAHERLADTHSTAEEAGQIAEMANVDTLLLYHMLTYRDTDAMRQHAQDPFSGTVYIAEDGQTFSVT